MAKQQLPPKSHEVWHVACRDIGMTVQDTAILILMVMDQDGALAAIAPLESSSRKELRALLTQAMLQPGAGAPRRPHQLVCEGEPLSRQIRAALKGVGVTVKAVTKITALDSIFASLLDSLGATSTLGIIEPERLQMFGQRLYVLAPWDHLWVNAYIHFIRGSGLDGMHAVFIGKLGLSKAMLLMPDAQTMHRVRSGPATPESLHIDALQMDPPESMSDAQLREAHQRGLILPGGEVMLMVAMRDGVRGLAPPEVQQRLLVALEAAVSLLESHDVSQIASGSQLCHDHVHQGETIHLHLEIPEDPTALTNAGTPASSEDAQPGEDSPPLVIIKAAKRDAVQLTAQVEGAEALLIQGNKLWVIKDGHQLGWIQVLTPEQIESWRQHNKIRLMISAGGAKRKTLYVKNVLSQQDLPLRSI